MSRDRIGVILLAAAFLFLAGAIAAVLWKSGSPPADPGDRAQVAQGKAVYDQHCATCHGAKLEGQPNWREKLPNGRMPAPPHDVSGHTWHHPDAVLFGITKHGLVPGKYAPPKYESDMPGFARTLSDDEIWAVLAYLKSNWPETARRAQLAVDREHRKR